MSNEALAAQRKRQLDMLDPAPLPKHHVPPPPPPPSHTANTGKFAALPVALAASIGLLVYASYKALNTAQIRLAIEDHAPELVHDLVERGVLLPFSEVVVDINREQLGERVFVLVAESDNYVSRERVLGVAKAIGSPALEEVVRSILATRQADEADYLTADQFITCFAQATLEDVPDDQMYFAVREAYDVVPLPRKVKAMLSNLHNQCVARKATFAPGEVHELCEKLSLPFDGAEESAAELVGLRYKHNFIDYFARKFEGADVATVLVRLKAILMYAATHPAPNQK